MSYTMLDWLYELGRVGGVPHSDCISAVVEAARDEERVVTRRTDIEALAAFARREGIDPGDDSLWDTGDEVVQNALLALERWSKERRDWERHP